MAWPPPLPSQVLATDLTSQATRHADDHNKIAAGLKELVGNQGTIINPWRTSAAILPGSGGLNAAWWWRIGPRVFVDTTLYIGTTPTMGTLGANVQITLPYPVSLTYTFNDRTLRQPGFVMTLTGGDYWGIMDLGVGTGSPTGATRVLFISGTSAAVVTGTNLNAAGMMITGSFSYATDAAP